MSQLTCDASGGTPYEYERKFGSKLTEPSIDCLGYGGLCRVRHAFPEADEELKLLLVDPADEEDWEYYGQVYPGSVRDLRIVPFSSSYLIDQRVPGVACGSGGVLEHENFHSEVSDEHPGIGSYSTTYYRVNVNALSSVPLTCPGAPRVGSILGSRDAIPL